MFQTLLVVVTILVVLETFTLMLHSIPLLIDEDPSTYGFDDALEGVRCIHSSGPGCLSMSFAE